MPPTSVLPGVALAAAGCLAACGGRTETKETRDSGAPALLSCPPEMAEISRDGDGLLCMDRFEVIVEGELGHQDQYIPGEEPTTATTRSLEGVTPATQVSWGQARRCCENTCVLGPDGERLGHKHLPLSSEWEDAGDGVIGEGGTRFPWGDTYVEGRCALPDEHENPTVGALQPTGSFPDCVSLFGVYDQIGNAWEWMDPEVDIDLGAFIARAEDDGRLCVEGSDVGILDASILDELVVAVAGIGQWTLEIDDEGHLVARVPTGGWGLGEAGQLGYLAWPPDDTEGETEAERLPACLLPIHALRLDEDDAGVIVELRVMPGRDGQPFTDKRGGAWYTGHGSDLQSAHHEHQHDFDGTIGFRCAWRG